jgi:hypothetical protein
VKGEECVLLEPSFGRECSDQTRLEDGFTSKSAPMGENGEAMRQFSSSLDSLLAHQMIQAIEEECERVEAGEW